MLLGKGILECCVKQVGFVFEPCVDRTNGEVGAVGYVDKAGTLVTAIGNFFDGGA
jgi:hypothetical protein